MISFDACTLCTKRGDSCRGGGGMWDIRVGFQEKHKYGTRRESKLNEEKMREVKNGWMHENVQW